MRCALGDAAAHCDVVAKQITEAGRGRNGRVRKAVLEAAQIAIKCGDAIWEMRKLIDPEATSPSQRRVDRTGRRGVI